MEKLKYQIEIDAPAEKSGTFYGMRKLILNGLIILVRIPI